MGVEVRRSSAAPERRQMGSVHEREKQSKRVRPHDERRQRLMLVTLHLDLAIRLTAVTAPRAALEPLETQGRALAQIPGFLMLTKILLAKYTTLRLPQPVSPKCPLNVLTGFTWGNTPTGLHSILQNKELCHINMLAVPDDLALLIFEVFAVGEPLRWPNASYDPDRARAPFTLAAVCRHWRQLARNTSSLWTYFGFPGDPQIGLHVAQLHRQRLVRTLSMDQPLDVIFHLDEGQLALAHRRVTYAFKLHEPPEQGDERLLAPPGLFVHLVRGGISGLPRSPSLSRLLVELSIFKRLEEAVPPATAWDMPCLASLNLGDPQFLNLIHAPQLVQLALECQYLASTEPHLITQRLARVERLYLYGRVDLIAVDFLAGMPSRPDQITIRTDGLFFSELNNREPPVLPMLEHLYLGEFTLFGWVTKENAVREQGLIAFLGARIRLRATGPLVALRSVGLHPALPEWLGGRIQAELRTADTLLLKSATTGVAWNNPS
ncbi:hypothetical protein BKA62DRAFT_759526 [Auriculariales sp. MPI-PUGE-AT-0066]|nr:hypothetical protein BKA62DRAFT_759526 [Auriculariales sp. MPI-PUGE-AT-0066]